MLVDYCADLLKLLLAVFQALVETPDEFIQLFHDLSPLPNGPGLHHSVKACGDHALHATGLPQLPIMNYATVSEAGAVAVFHAKAASSCTKFVQTAVG